MLLQRLGIPFTCQSPDIDELPINGESPSSLVERLAAWKAETASHKHPQAVVIGSDQLAVFNGQIIGKPGGYQAAQKQLTAFSGQTVEFLTAISVQCQHSGFSELHTDRTRVSFRNLHPDEIDRYLDKEKPFDCAGAFKAESLGITLFEQINSEDPTALIGLPLIATASILRRSGFQLP